MAQSISETSAALGKDGQPADGTAQDAAPAPAADSAAPGGTAGAAGVAPAAARDRSDAGSATAAGPGAESGPGAGSGPAADHGDGAATAAATAAGPRERDRGAGLATAALALSVVALAVVFTFWRQQSQLLQDLGSAREAAGAARTDIANTASALERRLEERMADQAARLRELEPAVATLERRLDELAGQDAALGARLEAQEARIATAEQGIARNQQALADAGGILRNARDRWVLAEAEYLMETANTALQLNGDPRAALAALQAADDHLRSLANPKLTATREALAGDLTALRSMAVPDIPGIALRLASLEAAVDALPLVEDRVTTYPVEGGDPDEPPGWRRAWSALKGAVSSMVTFRRDDADVIPLLEPDERFFLHRNLELQIAAARLAALGGDPVNYRLSLEAALRTLNTGFDPEASAVASMRAQLDELAAVDVAPERPDISGSLLALREAAAAMQ